MTFVENLPRIEQLGPGAIAGLLAVLGLALVFRLWPSPTSTARFIARLVVMGAYLPSMVAVGNLWSWLPAAAVGGGLARAWWPIAKKMVGKLSGRLGIRKMYVWLALALAMVPALQEIAALDSRLIFHQAAALIAVTVLALIHRPRLVVLLPLLYFAGLPALALPLAHYLVFAKGSDRNVALVVLIPMLVTGIAHV